MILDERTEFCDATALDTGGTGLALIGSQIDLGVARDMGNGQPLYCVIQVTTQVDSAADGASVEFQLVSDAAAAIAEDGSATVHSKSGAIAEATLAPGYQIVLPVPPEGSNDYEQYLGILQNVSGEAVTAGAVNAFLTIDPPADFKAYSDFE